MIMSLAAAITFSACNNENNASKEKEAKAADTAASQVKTSPDPEPKAATASINEVLSGYLQLKNALAGDNGKDAAAGANSMSEALKKIDKTAFSAEQKKVYDEVGDDVKEHAEHIGENAGKIAHQREHFDMMSKDMYDLVKAFGGGQTLYKDYCPMYNDGKGAIWISEAKEIKNPYLGKKMPTCGTVKEEIK